MLIIKKLTKENNFALVKIPEVLPVEVTVPESLDESKKKKNRKYSTKKLKEENSLNSFVGIEVLGSSPIDETDPRSVNIGRKKCKTLAKRW